MQRWGKHFTKWQKSLIIKQKIARFDRSEIKIKERSEWN